jgi:NADH-quinone oxidoreductase subunit M
MFKRMFFGDVNPEVKDYEDMNTREILYMLPLCIAVIVFGIFPSPILNIMKASVGQLVDLLSKY